MTLVECKQTPSTVLCMLQTHQFLHQLEVRPHVCTVSGSELYRHGCKSRDQSLAQVCCATTLPHRQLRHTQLHEPCPPAW